jgi:hypothetical protein
MIQSCDIVADFADIVQRCAVLLIQFEHRQIRERGVRAFDHGGEHHLLAAQMIVSPNCY